MGILLAAGSEPSFPGGRVDSDKAAPRYGNPGYGNPGYGNPGYGNLRTDLAHKMAPHFLCSFLKFIGAA
jgi:hypothetical protein